MTGGRGQETGDRGQETGGRGEGTAHCVLTGEGGRGGERERDRGREGGFG